ncbi:hypothetical protein [Marinobacter sp. CHS3-4]|uniref:hypothetical protein n=1 Tax=Marinobacter sp. CHS3-4 TaxID=3045174 RepID=UPI0024B58DFC|nr:hypothetical protein [Marinobacter sp. CHS3-4]MDI9244691.1 hypothetical protein [Marinobacter sp. CHS3-4]
MGTLIIILAVLFLSLIVVIPLIEKYAPKSEGQDFSKYSRWIIPLLMLLLVAQLLRYAFG